MPRYEYFCTGCEEKFELDVTIDERDAPCRGLCGVCDGEITRLYSPIQFNLKGSCWARDNYIRDIDKAEHYDKLCK